MIGEPVLVALVTAVGLILSGVLVELIRTRRKTETVAAHMLPDHGTSLRDAVDRVASDVRDLRDRMTRVETLVTERTERRG